MNAAHRIDTVLTSQSGVAAIMVAVGLTVFLGMAALAVDIGYRNVAQNELQNIVDAAALAGAGELGRQYSEKESYNEGSIVTIAGNVANSNASGFNIEVQVGTWMDRDTGFTDDDCYAIKCNAVKAIARRDVDNNSQVPTFFARIWNIAGLDAQADAVAALTGSQQVEPGELEVPVGISRQWFDDLGPDFCNQNIKFYPTSGTTGCAGWHVYDTWPANAQKLRDDILGGMLAGTFEPPGYNLEENPTSFAFIGGNLSTVQDNISALFDLHEPEWHTKVVVYDEDCGVNPNKTIKILGFADVTITGVVGPPPELEASVNCGEVNEGLGGSNYYGTWGSIPGLVE